MVKAFWVSRNPLVIKGEGQCKNTALRGTKDWPVPFLCLSHYVPVLAPYSSLHTFSLSLLTGSNMTPNACHCSQASTTLWGSVSQYLNFKCLTRSFIGSSWFRFPLLVQSTLPRWVTWFKDGNLDKLSHLQEGLWVEKASQTYLLHSSPFFPSHSTFIHGCFQQIFIKCLQKGY